MIRLFLSCLLCVACFAAPIDRQALVQRHDPVLRAVSPSSPLSLGNGGFAFTADVTGLQSLQALHTREGMPLETLGRAYWHSEPNPEGYTLADASSVISTGGRDVAYPNREKTPAGQWLRRNPHLFPLGQLGFTDASGAALDPADISAVEQRLELWSGLLTSRWSWRGVPVEVTTCVGSGADVIAVKAHSAALADGRLRISLRFPRGHDMAIKNTPPHDWSAPETHRSVLRRDEPHGPWVIARARDDFSYEVRVWSSARGDSFAPVTGTPHFFELRASSNAKSIEFTVEFRPNGPLHVAPFSDSSGKVSSVSDVQAETRAHWAAFWTTGAAVDFSGSTDLRAAELERRVVLSQYICGSQIGGFMPPQETGLTCNSWYGKHHTEMVWWHVAHFALWGRPDKVAEALRWFESTLPNARATATARGLRGARWSKMVGPDGRESPGGTSLIAWNQPHPIHLAELLWRANPRPEVLARNMTVVFETADCMVSMLQSDPAAPGRLRLGPPLWIAQELYDQRRSSNPTYELTQWRDALAIAQEWRVRLGLPREKAWDDALAALPPAPVREDKYVSMESIPDTWSNPETRHDHPSFLMAYGMLPGPGIDPATMRRTLLATLAQWRFEVKIWGWDYPMMAMSAARLGEPALAVDLLLRNGPNNRYLANGQCPQRKDLGVYLPANGSLLAAVAMMAGGWDGAPSTKAPGFPSDGSWQVHAEGFTPLR